MVGIEGPYKQHLDFCEVGNGYIHISAPTFRHSFAGTLCLQRSVSQTVLISIFPHSTVHASYRNTVVTETGEIMGAMRTAFQMQSERACFPDRGTSLACGVCGEQETRNSLRVRMHTWSKFFLTHSHASWRTLRLVEAMLYF